MCTQLGVLRVRCTGPDDIMACIKSHVMNLKIEVLSRSKLKDLIILDLATSKKQCMRNFIINLKLSPKEKRYAKAYLC